MWPATIDRTAREAIASACAEVRDAAETDQVDGVRPGWSPGRPTPPRSPRCCVLPRPTA